MTGSRFAITLTIVVTLMVAVGLLLHHEPVKTELTPEEIYAHSDYLCFVEIYREREYVKEDGTKAPSVSFSCGSGFLLNIDGEPFVASAAHLVDDEKKLKKAIALFHNGLSPQSLELVGRDPIMDVALFRFNQDADKRALLNKAARWGDSDRLVIGDPVFSLGADMDTLFSFSAGRVKNLSAGLGIYNPVSMRLGLGFSQQPQLILHDAVFNPGGSGGPLVNRFGDVVGINLLITGGKQSYNKAVPANDAKKILIRIQKKEPIIYSQLPFILSETNLLDDWELWMSGLMRPQEPGVMILFVNPVYDRNNSLIPRAGDTIRFLNGKKITTANQVMRQIMIDSHPEETLPVIVEREGKIINLQLPLKKMDVGDL